MASASNLATGNTGDATASDSCISMSGQSLRHAILSDVPNKLTELSLASNLLKCVDLTPLSECPDLEALVLNGNTLESIDLRPLASCSKLQKLWLHNNNLTNIDLTPLASCPMLRALYLDGNKIDSTTIDLSPLEDCRHLRSLRLGRNQLAGELDITPILSCMSLTSLDVPSGVRLNAYMSSDMTARPAPSSLPPALRRKAANINWQSLEDDLIDIDPSAEFKLLSDAAQSDSELRALLLGFRGNTKYAVEGLLEEHAKMKTLSISSVSPDLTPATVVSAGALRACHVILLRGSTEAMVQGLRSLDKTMPIFVIRNSSDDVKWTGKGATGVLSEPLVARDAFTVRRHAMERARAILRLRSQCRANVPSPGNLDIDMCGLFPTSPVTSSESSPPTGVPTVPFDRDAFSSASAGNCNPSLRQSRSYSAAQKVVSGTKKNTRVLKKSRWRGVDKSSSVTARIEDSGLSMAFSRHGGVLRKDDFHSVASICGLPLCLGSLLFDAVSAWTQVRQVPSTVDVNERRSSFRRVSSVCWSSGEAVSYEQFKLFWDVHLRSLDSEQRLFIIASLASGSKDFVSVESLTRITSDFIYRRNSSYQEVSSDARFVLTASLAEKIVWYELHGCLRSRLSRTELSRLAFCSSLLAAENGVYNGVTSHLRTDRLRGIFSAFEEAVVGNAGSDIRLSLDEVIKFNASRGLLSSRAVRAHFDLFVDVDSSGMTVAEFSPMWLATNDLSSSAASNYFFGLMDMDRDGYLSAFDVMHFYSEKYAMLEEDGFVPVEFMSIWQSILDSLKEARTSTRLGDRLVSLSEFHSICERERVTFWQSVLFLQDELCSVNIRETVSRGSPQAAKIACSQF